MKLTRPQHQALGALASLPAQGEWPQGTIRFGKWGFDSIRATRRTCENLRRRGLIEEYYEPSLQGQLTRVTEAGHEALTEADQALRDTIEREQAAAPGVVTGGEYALLSHMATAAPGTNVARGISELDWQQLDYLLRLSMNTKGYVHLLDEADAPGGGTRHLTERGANAYRDATAARRAHTDRIRQPIREAAETPDPTPTSGGTVVDLGPLRLELTAEQTQDWREANGLADDATPAQVAADIVTFLQYNTLHDPDTWAVRRNGD